MPDFAAAASTIRNRFQTELHNLRSIPIGFDNVDGLYTSNGDIVQESTDGNGDPEPWVTLNIRPSDATQITSGGKRRFRQPGVVIVQIFIPEGSGDNKAYEIADDVAAALRGVTVSGVRLKATSPPQPVGPDGAWWQANSRTEFEFDLLA